MDLGRRGRWLLAALMTGMVASGCGPEGGVDLPFLGGGDDGPSAQGGADDEPKGPGPWPQDGVKNYSTDYGLDWVQSAGIDEGHNIWVLREREIGVLRAGTTAPVWTSNVGQAAQPFSREARAMGSTVICGGEAGRAYVGYWTYDLDQPYRTSVEDPEFRRGDLDVVRFGDDGRISLETHLGDTTDNSGYKDLGIRNTIDWHYDEDRSVLTCARVMKGPFKGELYIGTNHGVTRIRGLQYNAHRHPVWDENGSLQIGYSHALGIGQNGDVLIGNEWKVAIISPPEALGDFEYHDRAPWQLDTYAEELNSLKEMDYWRAFQQTTDGAYFLGSEKFGLWRMERTQWTGDANFAPVKGLPSKEILALAATDDGSLFIGTGDEGLWRRKPDGAFERVSQVPGSRVTQLVYDPSVSPAMLLVVADSYLSVLRGY